nr:cryptochrome/photolyase family protein [Cytophagales bacterium]
MGKTIRLILGDQLNQSHSWFQSASKDTLFVMMEIRQETDYVPHHIQKVLAFFTAMRAFAHGLEKRGHIFLYLKLDDPKNTQSLTANLDWIINTHGATKFAYQLPDEYRLDTQLATYAKSLSIPVEVADTEHFLTSRDTLKKHFSGKKTYLMESFYRQMRLTFDILMEGDHPATGRWNYDADNRSFLTDTSLLVPHPEQLKSVRDVYDMLQRCGITTIGNVSNEQLNWPCTREEALELLTFFCEELLPFFGNYQDAMLSEDPFLFHSKLSFALNVKLIHPLEVIHAVEKRWKDDPEKYEIAQAEGFIRQILGWREYMRGVYWAEMPRFASLNYFEHQAPLPSYYWNGNTQMNCMSKCITQSLHEGYAHHIQRLMVTGNFALLAGIDPDQVDEWYLGIYIDAIQWVQITNTRGMSQYADGGIVGTKPYVSSANYIDKMSNYCAGCYYSKNKKFGAKACPFNSLYWAFYQRNRDKLEKHPRIGFVYRTLDRMKDREKILTQAAEYLNSLESL